MESWLHEEAGERERLRDKSWREKDERHTGASLPADKSTQLGLIMRRKQTRKQS